MSQASARPVEHVISQGPVRQWMWCGGSCRACRWPCNLRRALARTTSCGSKGQPEPRQGPDCAFCTASSGIPALFDAVWAYDTRPVGKDQRNNATEFEGD
jgi:hypothetical protein